MAPVDTRHFDHAVACFCTISICVHLMAHSPVLPHKFNLSLRSCRNFPRKVFLSPVFVVTTIVPLTQRSCRNLFPFKFVVSPCLGVVAASWTPHRRSRTSHRQVNVPLLSMRCDVPVTGTCFGTCSRAASTSGTVTDIWRHEAAELHEGRVRVVSFSEPRLPALVMWFYLRQKWFGSSSVSQPIFLLTLDSWRAFSAALVIGKLRAGTTCICRAKEGHQSAVRQVQFVPVASLFLVAFLARLFSFYLREETVSMTLSVS